MKRGFTVVELIITFSLTVVIATFLLQLILSLSNLYKISGIKTQIMNRQSLISNAINKKLNEKTIYSLTSCGNNCVNFNYTDDTTDVFKVDYSNNILQFGNFTTSLPGESYFKSIGINIIYGATVYANSNNAILNISIPIYNDKLNDDNYGVNIAYQYNSELSNIEYVDFSGGSDYIVLNGDTDLTFNTKTAYIEYGYTVYDKNGNPITGNVEIDNPLTTLPYKAGNYKIKYSLKDDDGNIVSQITRNVTVKPSTYEITNLVIDGSFENGNSPFLGGSITGGEIIINTDFKKNGQNSLQLITTGNSGESFVKTEPLYSFIPNHKYYYSLFYYTNSAIQLYFYNASFEDNGVIFCNYDNYGVSDWKLSSLYINNDNLPTNTSMFLRFDLDSNQGETAYFDNVLFIDLTEAFGAGNEPSQEWCDENINWFDGTTTINY